MSTIRDHHSCIVLEDKEQNNKVLVVGGYSGYSGGYRKTTEIFDIATQTWSNGIDIPITTIKSALIGASATSKYVAFLVGGDLNNQPNEPSNRIFGLNKNLTVWEEVAGTFEIPRWSHLAFQLPQDMMEEC